MIRDSALNIVKFRRKVINFTSLISARMVLILRMLKSEKESKYRLKIKRKFGYCLHLKLNQLRHSGFDFSLRPLKENRSKIKNNKLRSWVKQDLDPKKHSKNSKRLRRKRKNSKRKQTILPRRLNNKSHALSALISCTCLSAASHVITDFVGLA